MPQKFSKIRVLKVNYFHLPRKKYLKLKYWLNFNAIIVFTDKIQNLNQFSEKNLEEIQNMTAIGVKTKLKRIGTLIEKENSK